MKRPTHLVLACACLALVAPFLPAQTPDTRPHPETPTIATAAAKSFTWTLVPPSEKCPSTLESLSKDLLRHGGTVKLSINRVVDGDTVRLDPTNESVRLLGLDTEECFKGKGMTSPERAKMVEDFKAWKAEQLKLSKNPKHPPKYNTPLGEAAHDAMDKILKGAEEVALVYDDPARKIDGYGRVLGHLLMRKGTQWTHVNVEMVRQGLSPYFIKYGRCLQFDKAFEAAQSEAQAAKRGIWDPEEKIGNYNDYKDRLIWWKERCDDLETAHKERAKRADLVILGEPKDAERLMEFVGKSVVVVGSHAATRQSGNRVLYGLAHLAKSDFIIVGSKAEIAKSGLEDQEGNLVYVRGVIQLYRDKTSGKDVPQMEISEAHPIQVSRKYIEAEPQKTP